MISLHRAPLLALSLLLAGLSFAPALATANPCLPRTDLCVQQQGSCVAVVGSSGPDHGGGASVCPTASTGPSGTNACLDAWAGQMTIAGFRGVYVNACGNDDACVALYVQVDEFPSTLPLVCTP